ncbi:DUF4249 domain-containing protein [Mangrovivirga cuniculi]
MILKNKFQRVFILILLTFLLNGCIEPYDFVIENEGTNLVVEGYISNVSRNESTLFPSDGRYFSVKISYTSSVTNRLSQPVTDAFVELVDDDGNSWNYTETRDNNPAYYLYDTDFEALPDRKYQLRITLPNEEKFESEWVSLPSTQIKPMGSIDFEEASIDKYDYVDGKKEIITEEGVFVTVEIPENESGESVYYRWEYDPTWIIKTIIDANYTQETLPPTTCWAINKNYLTGYNLLEDIIGGYEKQVFFMPTHGNERIYEELSVLIIQQTLNKDYYNFWKELKESTSNSSINDQQPFNLNSNLKNSKTNEKISGYFDVVQEQAKRWYFNRYDLSYFVQNQREYICYETYGPAGPLPECANCLKYTNGEAVDIKPSWWGE